MSDLNRVSIDDVLRGAIREDVAHGDITSEALIPESHTCRAAMVAKEGCIIAGLPFARRVFHLVDPSVDFKILKREGSPVKGGSVIARIRGNTQSILIAERTALNILQRSSGIATLTRCYLNEVKDLKVTITDTRKTAPGLRLLDKNAVRAGGGKNHRYGLYDGVLIKDNHIAAAGGLAAAVRGVRQKVHHLLKIEVEVTNLAEVEEALKAGADVIMLDNMPVKRMKKAVETIRRRNAAVLIEASGNIHLKNVRDIAQTGVDVISVGSLTHSAPAADLSLKIGSF